MGARSLYETGAVVRALDVVEDGVRSTPDEIRSTIGSKPVTQQVALRYEVRLTACAAAAATFASPPVERLLIPRVDPAEQLAGHDLSRAHEACAIDVSMASSAAVPVGRAVVQMHGDFYLDLLLHLTFSLAFASPALPSSVPIRHLDRYQRAHTRARSLYETGAST